MGGAEGGGGGGREGEQGKEGGEEERYIFTGRPPSLATVLLNTAMAYH